MIFPKIWQPKTKKSLLGNFLKVFVFLLSAHCVMIAMFCRRRGGMVQSGIFWASFFFENHENCSKITNFENFQKIQVPLGWQHPQKHKKHTFRKKIDTSVTILATFKKNLFYVVFFSKKTTVFFSSSKKPQKNVSSESSTTPRGF